VSLVLFMVAVAQIVGRRFTPRKAMITGITIATLGWGCLAWATVANSALTMIAGSTIVGAGAGLCLLGSAGLVGRISPRDRRAEIYSAYLIIAFIALGTMAVASGAVIKSTSISMVLLASCGLSVILALYILVFSRRIAAP